MRYTEYMIQSVHIQNFKAWEDASFSLDSTHVAFVGEHGSGKSSILQALDYFFNHEYIEKECVIDPRKDVEIAVRVNGTYLKKRFTGKAHRATVDNPGSQWRVLDGVHYLYLFGLETRPCAVLSQLARARMDLLAPERMRTEITSLAMTCLNDLISGMETGTSNADHLNPGFNETPCIHIGKAASYDFDFKGTVFQDIAEQDAPLMAEATKNLLTCSDSPNVILAIDEIETSFAQSNFAELIENLERSFGQLLFTTHSSSIMSQSNNIQTIPLGKLPQNSTASILSGLETDDRTFMLVEGKFDLPWYRSALDLLGVSQRYIVLPGGGSNTELLRKELRKLGAKCLLILDGDMKTKANPRKGVFALNRECIELYTPDSLMNELFQCTPPKSSKTAFFNTVRANGYRYSDDSIKDIIASRIGPELAVSNPFVEELNTIISYQND